MMVRHRVSNHLYGNYCEQTQILHCVLSNTDCAISKQLFLQQPASLQSTDHFISFQSLASVTHGHGTQALYWRCAKQKDRAKIFHCFKLENKASSRSAPPTTWVASLYTLDPQEFFGRPRRCGCSAIRGRRV